MKDTLKAVGEKLLRTVRPTPGGLSNAAWEAWLEFEAALGIKPSKLVEVQRRWTEDAQQRNRYLARGYGPGGADPSYKPRGDPWDEP